MTREELIAKLAMLGDECRDTGFDAVAGVLYSLTGHVILRSERIALDAIMPSARDAVAKMAMQGPIQ